MNPSSMFWMLYRTSTPADASEILRYLDQLAKSQCRVTFSVPERETQNQFSCRGDVTFSRAFTAQVKVKHESSARSKTHTRAFQTNWFFHFSANFKNKIEQNFLPKLGNPRVMLHCTPAELKNAEVLLHHKVMWLKRNLHPSNPTMHMTRGISTSWPKRLIPKYPVYTHLQTQRNTSILTCHSQTATCKVHRLNPL